jgi:hypothetical protein
MNGLLLEVIREDLIPCEALTLRLMLRAVDGRRFRRRTFCGI